MMRLTERLPPGEEADASLTLPFELRERSRFRARLDDGREAGVMLPRGGQPLRGGERLRAEDGTVVRIAAAPESVSTAFHRDPRMVARAAYHLGNRHVALEVGDTWVRYRHDHVLDEMVTGLGLRVFPERAPFEPEAGAYAHGHAHGHGQSGSHAHSHTHSHGDDHGAGPDAHFETHRRAHAEAVARAGGDATASASTSVSTSAGDGEGETGDRR
ncbi:urease accessory protein UreE [Spiribacter halobius]|uniref:Urease accessory protein UreE n=1 Tax=Sediminicurvatus halobius TaxID=2182432 RepID=A0A2U2N981_9GAMM|nr:urease accessory protein UreE [Spiribacter halobius]